MWFIVEPLNNRHIILSIIERLSSFRGKNVVPLYRLVHWKVSSIQRCPYSECPLSEVPLYTVHLT